MEKKKISNLLYNAGSAVKGAIDKSTGIAVNAMDQNDDGKFDMSDVSAIAGTVGGAVRKGASAVIESAEESRRRMDLKNLQPIFGDTLDQAEFFMSKLIRVVDRDKKHAESDVCQGSIGFLSDKGGLRVVNIFRDSLEVFGLTFYPDIDSEFYYVNPTDRDNYIALDNYFERLKVVRVTELQRVAQDLGAKYFRVTYKEEQTTFTETKKRGNAKVTHAAEGEVNKSESEKRYSRIEVAAELHMDGHAPQRPKLVYLLKDDTVQNLIELRMNGGESFRQHKLSIKMSNSIGIKESDAIKIDAALKGMKVASSTTVASEAQKESRRYLEYEIEF